MTQKALIIDDEQAIVDLVRHHLEKEGFQCLEANDGETALRLARENKPDLLILDLMLPGLMAWKFAGCFDVTLRPLKSPLSC